MGLFSATKGVSVRFLAEALTFDAAVESMTDEEGFGSI